MVTHGESAAKMPAICPVRCTLEAILNLVFFARANASVPARAARRDIIGMKDILPAIFGKALLFRQARVLKPAPVVVVGVTVRARRPDDLRHGVCQRTITLLARFQQSAL